MKKRGIAALALAVLAIPAAVFAAGSWSNWVVVGGQSYCASTVSGVNLPATQGPFGVVPGSTQGNGGSICGETVPAGPASQTEEELIPVDIPAPASANNGSPTNSGLIPSGLVGSLNTHYNRVIGGDFATNLWQRGTTPVSGASPTTYQMSADRFFAISASNVMTVSKQTPATTGADYLGASGLYSWMRVARPSGTPTGSSCVGQILDREASQGLIGANAVLSFWGYAPTTFSATASDITVSVAYYTAADSATAGTNTATFALSGSGQTGGIAGYQAAVAGLGNGTPGSVASGVATIPLSVTPTRYSVYAPIPSVNSAGTEVLGVGLTFCATPTLTTTVATDYFEIEGVQLQGTPSAVTTALPNGVTGYTGFERRQASQEAMYQLSYSYVLTDGAASQRYGLGQTLSTSTANFVIQFPELMREVPTATVGTTISFGATQAAGTAQACGTSIASVNATPLNATLLCTTGATNLAAAGGATQMIGQATGGIITWSAEP